MYIHLLIPRSPAFYPARFLSSFSCCVQLLYCFYASNCVYICDSRSGLSRPGDPAAGQVDARIAPSCLAESGHLKPKKGMKAAKWVI